MDESAVRETLFPLILLSVKYKRKIKAMSDRERSRSPDRGEAPPPSDDGGDNNNQGSGDNGDNGDTSDEVRLYIGNLDYCKFFVPCCTFKIFDLI